MSIFEDRVIERLDELPTREVGAGQTLIKEGGAFDSVFFLKSGTLAIGKGSATIAEVSARGAVFGEMSHFLEQPAVATVTAVNDVVVYEASEPGIFFMRNPTVLIYVARILSSRINELNKRLLKTETQGTQTDVQIDVLNQLFESLMKHDPDAIIRDADFVD